MIRCTVCMHAAAGSLNTEQSCSGTAALKHRHFGFKSFDLMQCKKECVNTACRSCCCPPASLHLVMPNDSCICTSRCRLTKYHVHDSFCSMPGGYLYLQVSRCHSRVYFKIADTLLIQSLMATMALFWHTGKLAVAKHIPS